MPVNQTGMGQFIEVSVQVLVEAHHDCPLIGPRLVT